MRRASVVAKSVLIVSFFALLVAVVAAGWALIVVRGMPAWQAVVALGICLLLPASILYPLVRAARWPADKESSEREQETLDDVVRVRGGRVLGAKTAVGRLYAGAILAALAFPLFARVIAALSESDDSANDAILSVGLTMIGVFLAAVALSGRSWKK